MIEKLRPVSPGAVPDVDPDLVSRALATFASTSGAAWRASPLSPPGCSALLFWRPDMEAPVRGRPVDDERGDGASSPTALFVWSQLVKRFVDFVARSASTSCGAQYTLFWNRSRSVCIVQTTWQWATHSATTLTVTSLG